MEIGPDQTARGQDVLNSCGRCPPLNLTREHGVNTRDTTVGIEVTVTCGSQYQFVVTCQHDRSWDTTIPPCPTETSTFSVLDTVGHENGAVNLLIIVWVLGGLLLTSLLVLMALLVSSKKKFATNNGNRDSQESIFTIGGGRQTRGGDNPAFCRADEDGKTPSDHEIMTGCIISVPATEVPSGLTTNASSSRTPPRSQRQQQPLGTDAEREYGQGSLARAPRYVCEYPSCFWEEEPPPPYSPATFDVVQTTGIQTHEQERSERRELIARNQSPNPARAPLAVPTPTVLSPASSPALVPRRELTLYDLSCAALPSRPGSTVSLASSSPLVTRHRHILSSLSLAPWQGEARQVMNIVANIPPISSSRGHLTVQDNRGSSRSTKEQTALLARLDSESQAKTGD